MDEKGQDKVMAFDTLFTTNHLQMLKVLTSYLDPAAQKKHGGLYQVDGAAIYAFLFP